MIWEKTAIAQFLEERKGRYKPDVANNMGLKRLSKIDFQGNVHIVDWKHTKTSMILVKKGDLVISGINADKGAVSIYQGEDDVMATIHYSSYTFDNMKIDIDYLKWYLKSKVFLKILKTQTKGGIKTELKPKRLLPLVIDLPKTDTQKQILKKIESVEDEYKILLNDIDNLQQLKDKLRQSILQEAIQGKLTSDWRKENPTTEPASTLLARIKAEKTQLIAEKKIKKEKALPPITEEEIPFELPEGWAWYRLGEVSISSLGKMLDSGKNKGLNKPYLRNFNVKWKSFDLSDVKKMRFEPHEEDKYSVKKGDVMICEGGYPGRAAIWKNEYNIMFQKAIHRVRFLEMPYYAEIFVHFLMLIDFTREIEKYFTGAGIQHLTGRSLKKMIIPLPPLAEQHAIVQKVEALLDKVAALEEEVAASQVYAEQLMQAVLKEAFEGK